MPYPTRRPRLVNLKKLWAWKEQRVVVDHVEQNLQGTKEREDCVVNINMQLDAENLYEGGLSIFEVPKNLQKLEPDSFIPNIVSIGPYHKRNKQLKEMEKHKRRLLKHVLQRTKLELNVLVEAMFQIEEKARSCYDKPIEGFTRQEFVEMMLLDACFILDLFYVTVSVGWMRSSRPSHDPYGLSLLSSFLHFIQRDLLMLENQLPLFVLDRVYALTCDESISDGGVIELALKFFDSILPGISNNLPHYKKDDLPQVHLLDVVHRSLKPSNYIHASATGALNMQSVTRLRGTNIGFQKNDSTRFTDIEFKKGELLIPTLFIHDSTKAIFLNLMAFEQCYTHCKRYITSYVTFMDGLIDSAKDVEYLQKKDIIVHLLGSDEDVAHLFNNLRREIIFDHNEFYLSEISNDLNRHYKRNWHRWAATLKHEYVKDPWKIIALSAAVLIVILTTTQTIYNVLSYYLHKS